MAAKSSKHPPDPVDVAVGSRVRLLRMAKGLSQEKLAAGLALTFQQLQKYEKGTNRISASKLAAIAGLLGCSVGTFFGEDGTTTQLEPFLGLQRTDITIAQAAARLTGQQKAHVLNIINAITEATADRAVAA